MKLNQKTVTIGQWDDLCDQQFSTMLQTIKLLKPWRKGPFELFGQKIDAEWQSNLKWDRIAPALGSLHGRRVLDVGCGNGYYMFRAAADQPDVVIGFDPSLQFELTFALFQRFARLKNLFYERLGAEHLHVFDRAFDVALCMGVLYHRKNPLEILQQLRKTLRVGGLAIIESQTIPGAGSLALFPQERYAKARNVFFVPTRDGLVNWVKRAGFKDVEVVSHTRVTTVEQRATRWMDFESLSDFLDPDHPRADDRRLSGSLANGRSCGEKIFVKKM